MREFPDQGHLKTAIKPWVLGLCGPSKVSLTCCGQSFAMRFYFSIYYKLRVIDGLCQRATCPSGLSLHLSIVKRSCLFGWYAARGTLLFPRWRIKCEKCVCNQSETCRTHCLFIGALQSLQAMLPYCLHKEWRIFRLPWLPFFFYIYLTLFNSSSFTDHPQCHGKGKILTVLVCQKNLHHKH